MTLNLLIKSNSRILQQKLNLLEFLERGCSSNVLSVKCPLVGASIGQHMRHSVDHIELAAEATLIATSDFTESDVQPIVLNYDVRKRGANDETLLHAAKERLLTVKQVLDSIAIADDLKHLSQKILNRRIDVLFLSDAERSTEMRISSNIARELSFVAHHAIHHLALIKIIGLNLKAFSLSDLPTDFGKAPSTVLFERIG